MTGVRTPNFNFPFAGGPLPNLWRVLVCFFVAALGFGFGAVPVYPEDSLGAELFILQEADFSTARVYARILSLQPNQALEASISISQSGGSRREAEREVLMRTLLGGMQQGAERGWSPDRREALQLRGLIPSLSDPMLRAGYIGLLSRWDMAGQVFAAEEIDDLQQQIGEGTLAPGRAITLLQELIPAGEDLSPDMIFGLSRLLALTDSPELVRVLRELAAR